MKTEDYKRAVCAMGAIHPDDRSAITIMLKQNGEFFISTAGEPEEVVALLDKFVEVIAGYADHCDATSEQQKGGRK